MDAIQEARQEIERFLAAHITSRDSWEFLTTTGK